MPALSQPSPPTSTRLPLPPGELPLSVSAVDVRGMDQPLQSSRDCAQELTEVRTSQSPKLWCLFASRCPLSFRYPKTVGNMNDYRPVALTPIIMKCLERLVLAHIIDTININVDPHQYAYRKNRSLSDAVSAVVHSALTHLKSKDSYVRLLILDFSSAFNTIIPQTIVNKLLLLGLEPSLYNWVLDFLTRSFCKAPEQSYSEVCR